MSNHRSTPLLTVILLTATLSTMGQFKPAVQTFAKKQKGVGFVTTDSTFSLNFQFRIQNRALYTSKTDDGFAPESYEFRVRRLRMKFTGFVINPKLNYYIQLSFSRGDMDWRGPDNATVNNSPNVVRDAVIYYSPNAHWRFGLGQTKLPGNRQRVVSSGDLQFYERSIVNARFNIDRDFGFFSQYVSNYVILKAAVTSGEGRNADPLGRNTTLSNGGLAYTGRLELLPMGAFTGENDNIEGDLMREQKIKMSWGATVSHNDRAIRQAGQLGNDLYEARSLTSFEVDWLTKYKGAALFVEYMNRSTDNAVTVNPDNTTQVRTVYVGYGLLTQGSYLFKNNFEIAARYATTKPNAELYDNAAFNTLNERQMENYELGITKYLNGHRVKVQGGIMYTKLTDLRTNTWSDGYWTSCLQVELGI